jgi:Bifunctional DNA primase/polymerase, N-terminal
MSNVNIALRCARAGLHVFPVSPDSRKRPTVRGSWRENSTTDTKTIEAWWRIRAIHLPAVDLHKAELLVLDGDRHPDANGEIIDDGVEALRTLFRERGTSVKLNPVVWTPSGGVHLYFKCPPGFGNAEGDLPAGINVRGSGGYVVAPGSARPDGKSYVPGKLDLIEAFERGAIPPLPDWLCEIIRKPLPEQQPIVITRQRGRRFECYAATALDRMAQELSAKPTESGRNEALNLAAWKMGTMAARGWIGRSEIEDVLFQAATACHLVKDTGAKSVKATIASGLSAGISHPHPDLRHRS